MPNIENDASHFCGYITIKKKKKKNALAIDLKKKTSVDFLVLRIRLWV